MSDIERSGGCLCGAVRFVARGAPVRAPICHCRTCQKNTGSPFLAALIFKGGQVEITGELKTFQAPEVERRFCPQCGSLVCLTRPGRGECIVMLGSFDEPPAFVPDYEIYVTRRHSWLPEFAGTKRYAEYTDGKPLEDA